MYRILLNLHIISAFSFIGAIMFIAFKGIKLSQNQQGISIVKKAHLLTAISGWLLLLTGFSLLYVVNGIFLTYNWMRFSIGLFLFIQFFDHFWADKQEEKNEQRITKFSYLNIWLILKVLFSLIIMLLMYLKPI